jgi:hypothetical protein
VRLVRFALSGQPRDHAASKIDVLAQRAGVLPLADPEVIAEREEIAHVRRELCFQARGSCRRGRPRAFPVGRS